MQGSLLVWLGLEGRRSHPPNGVEKFAAALLVAAAWVQGVKELVNWRQGIEDEFRKRPFPGFWAARIQSPMASLGLVIIVFGVIRGL